MDHSKAYMIELEADNAQKLTQTVYSEHDTHEREDGEGSDTTNWGTHTSNNEHRKQHRLKNLLDNYYKTLEKLLEPYGEVLLCGSGTAKHELFNRLDQLPQFNKTIIHMENMEEVSENQLKAYVRKFFESTNAH
jgi:hypothetical protein